MMFLSKSSLLTRPGGVLQSHIRHVAISAIHDGGARAASTSLFPHLMSKSTIGTTNFATAATSTPPGGLEPTKPRSLTRGQIIKEVASAHELSVAQSQRIVDTVFDTIVEAVADDRRVEVARFGTFESYTSKETKRINPRTGDPVLVPPKKRIRFRPFVSFHNTLRKGDEI